MCHHLHLEDNEKMKQKYKFNKRVIWALWLLFFIRTLINLFSLKEKTEGILGRTKKSPKIKANIDENNQDCVASSLKVKPKASKKACSEGS